MTDSTYQPKVYRKAGGGEQVVASGGLITVESGGIIALETGGDLTVNGVSLIDEVAALSGLDSGELGVLNGVVAGTTTASKALVVGADKNLDTLAIADGGLKLGAGAGTAVSATAAELNYLDLTALGTGAASKAVVLDADGRYRLPSTGTLFNAGKATKAQAAPAAKTVTAGITAAELVAGLITTTGATGPSVHQLPTGTEIDAAIPGIATGDSFDFTLINTGTGAAEDATITVNTDVTIVGNPTVGALTDATIISGSGTFRARRSAANSYVVYRLA